MQIAIVVTAGETDLFIQMARVNTAAIRIVEPQARVVCVVDEQSACRQAASFKLLFKEVDDVVTVESDFKDAASRSRDLKTRLRSFLIGDFLFLDVDAVPVASLQGAFATKCKIAACYDRNLDPRDYVLQDFVEPLCRESGWSVPSRYFNSGVILWRDTPETHEFSACWHSRWLHSQREGRHEDQPSFNSIVEERDFDFGVLPNKFNGMIQWKRSNAARAHVIHFYTSCWESKQDTVFYQLVEKLRASGELDYGMLERFVDSRYPWVDDTWIQGQIACGNYSRAAWLAVKKKVLRCAR